MRFAFMAAHEGQHTIAAMCRVLRVRRSGYYAWRGRGPSQRIRQERELVPVMCRLHDETKQSYGAVKLWRALNVQGIRCGKHKVARLRRAQGLETRRIKRYRRAYSTNHSAPAPNLLNQSFTVDALNRVWVSDITFIPTRSGWLHLCVYIDLYARRVVGWSMGSRPNQRLVLDAMQMAIERRSPGKGLIVHTDQGQQYNGALYKRLLAQHGMVQSMSRRGHCYDNAVAESFFSTIKNDLVHHETFNNREQAKTALFEFIEVFYNRKRLHQTLDYQTPANYETINQVA
jgi:putative transposase